MGSLVTMLKKFLFWSYDRGSWQYDVLCGLILAFIFFGPNSVFHSADGDLSAPVTVEAREVGPIEEGQYDRVLSDYFSRKYNLKVRARNVQPLYDERGNLVGYLVKQITR